LAEREAFYFDNFTIFAPYLSTIKPILMTKYVLSLLTFSAIMLSVFSACTVTVDDIDDDDNSSVEISDAPAVGSIGENMPFTLETALVEQDAPFGDPGYFFYLHDTTATCNAISSFNSIRFFVESSTELEPGEYKGSGPFITNTSFFGCDVVITSVTESLIEGKVKGGDIGGEKYVEGSFSAELCN
jgi:hypothetical protein